ncbi:MAG: flavin monoamine oxidase family protein, partial [Candidatus Kapaibacterium sp.]
IKPFLEKIRADADSLPQNFDFLHPGNAAGVDAISLAEYFHTLGVSGWIKDLLEVAYVSEYGLELADQSALNFITLVSTDIAEEFKIFGTSDERYKIKGGNQTITSKLSDHVTDQIHLSHKFESIRSKGKGFTLTFQDESAIKDIDADIVIMALPFSVLRDVEIKIELPPWKKKAIQELGYGTNSKIMTGFTKRLWRNEGYLGEVFGDEHFQLAWDNAEFQTGEAGGMTSFNGGNRGLQAGSGTVGSQSDLFTASLEKVFPGIAQIRNGKNHRFHWPSYPFTKGSYAAYKPGQWTTIRGAEAAPIGNLFFAGEHCSLEYQGFMNGGAETGRKAAEDVLKLLD